MSSDQEPLQNLRIDDGPVTVLFGESRGKYPQGNSLLVQGEARTALIDPSLGLLRRRGQLPCPHFLLHSHCHEDHIAGSHLFEAVPWHFHEFDLPGIRSLDALMEIYGFSEVVEVAFRKLVVDHFHFRACDNPVPFRDGDRFDLGSVRIEVLHTPGHTRGHCCFRIRWEQDDGGILYLGDIDLSGFGPYYGDAWSCLEDFERSIETVRSVEARWYATFHHIGVVDRPTFLERLGRFAEVFASREQRLLSFLSEPRSLADIIQHRFVYRRSDPVPFADGVEERSMSQHLERLLRSGRAVELSPGRFSRV